MAKNKKKRDNFAFFLLKCFLRIFIWKPKYYMLGDFEFDKRAIYISNHSKATGPISAQLYFPIRFRFWGTHEMCTTFKKRYIYLAYTFFHIGWRIKCMFICHILACIATPFVTIFYHGSKVIPTYTDNRLLTTYKESLKVLLEDEESIYIFPEDISKGYYDEMKDIHSGYFLLGERCLKKGVDLPIYLMYYQRNKRRMIVNKPIYFSEVLEKYKTKEYASEFFKEKLNEFAKLNTIDLERRTHKVYRY